MHNKTGGYSSSAALTICNRQGQFCAVCAVLDTLTAPQHESASASRALCVCYHIQAVLQLEHKQCPGGLQHPCVCVLFCLYAVCLQVCTSSPNKFPTHHVLRWPLPRVQQTLALGRRSTSQSPLTTHCVEMSRWRRCWAAGSEHKLTWPLPLVACAR